MNQTRISGPISVDLGADRVTASFQQVPSGPFALLHIAGVIRFHAVPGLTDPDTLRDLAAKATEIANWLEQQTASGGELDAA